MKLSHYINFPGNCREAFEFYAELFSVEVAMMEPFRGTPAEERAPDESWLDKIMHAEIFLDGQLIMASDTPPNEYKKPQGMRLKITADDLPQGQNFYDKLSEGGEVVMAFEPAFWTPGFGMCIDKFGVPWIIDVAK